MIGRTSVAAVFLATALWGCTRQESTTDRRTISSVESVAPGDQCPAGGQKILTGIDLNGDGVLETNEVTQVAYVCNGQSSPRCTTLEGSITIRNSFDWANLAAAGCTTVTGTLEIAAQGAHTLGGPSPLVEVGALSITDNDVLTVLEFPDLARVRGDVLLRANPALARLALPSLEEVSGGFTLDGSSVADVSFPSVKRLNVLSVTAAPALTSISLPALEVVDGELSIADATALTTVSLPRLQAATAVTITGASALRELHLPALVWGGSLFLGAVPGLEVLDATALTSVASLLIDGAPALASVTLPALQTVSNAAGWSPRSGLAITSAPALTSVSLPALAQADEVSLDAPALPSLSLPALAQVGGALSVSASALAQLDLHALASASSVSVVSDALSALDLAALAGDTSLYLVCPALVSLNVPGVSSAYGVTIGSAKLETLSLPALASLRGELSLFGVAYADPSVLTRVDLPALTSVRFSVKLNNHPALTSFSIPNLTGAAGLAITNMASLESVSFPLVTTLPGYSDLAPNSINFTGDPALTTVDLPLLSTARYSVIFKNDASLATVHLPALTTAGALTLQGNAALAGVSLPALTSVRGSIVVNDDPALADFVLPALTTTGSLYVFNDPALTTVSLPALGTVYNLQVYQDSALTTLDLPALGTSGTNGSFVVHDNPVLPQCHLDAILAGVTPAPRTVTMSNNDTTATCP